MRKLFRELLESNKRFIGCYIMHPADAEIEVMKLAGYDFLIFDLEHDQLTFSEITRMIRTSDGCGMATMVRVPGVDEGYIKKALDIGASAIKVPGISTAEQARQVVSLCKYPPEGTRGVCPYVRCNGYGSDKLSCYERANREVSISVIIEGIEGVKNCEEIIAVPGIDSISVGNFDLSAVLGIPGQTTHPLVMEKVMEVAAMCAKYGKSCSVQVVSPEDAKQYQGVPGVSHYHTDMPLTILYRACKELCEGLHANS